MNASFLCLQHEALGPQYEEFPTLETDPAGTGCTGMQRLGAKLG